MNDLPGADRSTPDLMTPRNSYRVVFLGDICVQDPLAPVPDPPQVLREADLVVANLEGPVVTPAEAVELKASRRLALFNTTRAIDVLQSLRVSAVTLANNHIYDLRLPASATGHLLEEAGIQWFGAGASLHEASRDLSISIAGHRLRIAGFGWAPTGCRMAGRSREGVNPLTGPHMLNTIRQIRCEDPDACVVFFAHWNHELESYPQPAHRQLAHDLVQAGVDTVVGAHPHVVGGIEDIHGKIIAYSLGNWFFPPVRLGPLRLRFPPSTRRQLALELEIRGREILDVKLHWFDFDPETLTLIETGVESPKGNRARELTPWVGAYHGEYARWFRANRRRRRGLPVYWDYRHRTTNSIKDLNLALRARVIRGLVRWGLKGGPRE